MPASMSEQHVEIITDDEASSFTHGTPQICGLTLSKSLNLSLPSFSQVIIPNIRNYAFL